MDMININDKVHVNVFNEEGQMDGLITPIEIVSSTKEVYVKFEFTITETKKLISALQGALDG